MDRESCPPKQPLLPDPSPHIIINLVPGLGTNKAANTEKTEGRDKKNVFPGRTLSEHQPSDGEEELAL